MIKNIFCPNCQTQIQVNDEKEFCFCLQCGNKIILKFETAPISNNKSNVENDTNAFIEKKLEEVKFYYDLSKSKNEHLNFQKEPIYYLKAQDILVDLSESYPDEYRIWWELSKPIDFGNPLVGTEAAESYVINEDYFNKALDRAEISQKKELIAEHDRYIEEKKTAKLAYEKKLKEEAEERARREEEERKKREEELRRQREKERKEAEERARREEEERKKREEELRRQREKERKEAEERARREEEERKKREEEFRRQQEELRLKHEEELRRQQEEKRKKAEERARLIIEEKRRKEEEKRQRKEEKKKAKEQSRLEAEERKKAEERARLEAEERKRQEKELRRQQEEENKKKTENIHSEKSTTDDAQIRKEIYNKGIATSENIWKELKNKNYSKIDNGYFEISADLQKYICIFKKLSNMLYLMVYRYKDNNLYNDQTITVKFDDKGRVFKFDNKALKVKIMLAPDNTLNITDNGDEGIYVSGIPLIINKEYTDEIIKSAKKSILGLGKIFV